MNLIYNFDGHIGMTDYAKILKSCTVLFRDNPITYFCYQRLYPDNYYTGLSSSPCVAEYFFSSEQVYQQTWLFNTPYSAYQTGFYFWNTVMEFLSPEQKKISLTLKKDMKLAHGIDIVEKRPHFCDIYSFASNSPDIYFCSIAYLKKFIFYFKQECREIIQDSWRQKILVPSPEKTMKLPIITAEINAMTSCDDFNITKYYIFTGSKDVYLTQKEVICLQEISKGATAKEVAVQLDSSYRTVEKHIQNLKEKLDCTTITSAIKIAESNFIYI